MGNLANNQHGFSERPRKKPTKPQKHFHHDIALVNIPPMSSIINLPKPAALKPLGAPARGQALGLAAQLKRSRVDSSHHSSSLVALMVSSGLCKLTLDENLFVRSIRNGMAVLGTRKTGISVAQLFNTREAADYFSALHAWLKEFRSPPRESEDQIWRQVFPAHDDPSLNMDNWIPYPDDAWKVTGNRARTQKTDKGIEFYLVSPRELIGPEDDFRIEYTARTDDDPHDLTVVVGGIVDRTPEEAAFVARPEDHGYCFAFGAMANSITELQRSLLSVASSEEVRIIQGKNHLCEAERIGGFVRFVVDGRESYRYSDPLPIFGRGHGYVSLYSYEKNHVFWDLKVFTRPTSLSPKDRKLIPTMRRKVLPVRTPDGKKRHVEVCHMGSTMFIVKDIPVMAKPKPKRNTKPKSRRRN